MSPCRQKGLLRFGSSIFPPLSFRIYVQIGVSRSPLTSCREQFTLKLIDIDERSRSAISGFDKELPSETLCRRLQNCIRAGRGHLRHLRGCEGKRARLRVALKFFVKELLWGRLCRYLRSALQEWTQPCRGLELRDRIEFLEGAREGVREAPHRSRSELLDLWIEVQVMDSSSQVPGGVELTFDESPVDGEFRGFVRETRFRPGGDLLLHRLEIALHPIHSDRERVYEAQVLGVLGEHRTEISVKRHVVANEHPVADREREAHGFVVGVAEADRKSATLKDGFEVQDSEHLHPVFRHCIFVPHHGDVPEAQGFN